MTIHMTTGGGGAPSRQLAHRRVREVLAATTEVVGRGIGAEAAGGGSALGASGSGTYIAERGHVTRDGRGTVWCGPRGAVRGLRCAAPPGWTLGAMDRDVETGPWTLPTLSFVEVGARSSTVATRGIYMDLDIRFRIKITASRETNPRHQHSARAQAIRK